MTKFDLSKKARSQMILRGLLAPIFMIGLLFLVAGRWDYWQAWVYTVINLIVLILMGTLLPKNSELVEERLNPKEGIKGWDKFYFAATGQWAHPQAIIGYILGASILLVATAAFVGWKIPFIQNDQQALVAIVILVVLKVLNAVTHYLLSRA